MSNWHVGMKVVCMDDSHATEYLKRGSTYTISLLFECHGLRMNVAEVAPDGARVCGECGKPIPTNGLGFYASRFRPLDLLSAALDRIEEESVTIEEPQHA